MVHIKLITIKRQLQARMNYPLTREEAGEEYMTLDEAFDTLLYGFQRYIDRQQLAARTTVSNALKRGYFSEKFADMFTDYCIKGWRIV